MRTAKIRSPLAQAAIVAAVTFLAAWLGILTRPADSLAAFWPANALLLGIFVRWPRMAGAPSWIAALAAYIAADLSTGSTPLVSVWLNLANMSGVMGGYVLFQFVPARYRRLAEPRAVLLVIGLCATASLIAGMVGGGVCLIFFRRDLLDGVAYWFTAEFVNYVTVLPALLAIPGRLQFASWSKHLRRTGDIDAHAVLRSLPALTLGLSMGLALSVGGPGAIAFAVPALLWCGMVYGTFVTAALTAIVGGSTLVSISLGIVSVPIAKDAFNSVIALRLCLAMLAVGPLVLASAMQARAREFRKLRLDVGIDGLTDTLKRTAFLREVDRHWSDSSNRARGRAVLIIDLDHFKAVNDQRGHQVGDSVLQECARRLRKALRTDDLLGRVGGDEFAAMLPGVEWHDALALAERVRFAIDESPVSLDAGLSIPVTASVGMAFADDDNTRSPDQLMLEAHSALYGAKTSGRNRVGAVHCSGRSDHGAPGRLVNAA